MPLKSRYFHLFVTIGSNLYFDFFVTFPLSQLPWEVGKGNVDSSSAKVRQTQIDIYYSSVLDVFMSFVFLDFILA